MFRPQVQVLVSPIQSQWRLRSRFLSLQYNSVVYKGDDLLLSLVEPNLSERLNRNSVKEEGILLIPIVTIIRNNLVKTVFNEIL